MGIKEKKQRFLYAGKYNHFSKKRNLIDHWRIQKEYLLLNSDFQRREPLLKDQIGINKEYLSADSSYRFTEGRDIM